MRADAIVTQVINGDAVVWIAGAEGFSGDPMVTVWFWDLECQVCSTRFGLRCTNHQAMTAALRHLRTACQGEPEGAA